MTTGGDGRTADPERSRNSRVLDQRPASLSPVGEAESGLAQSEAHTRLRGRARWIARTAWVLVVLLSVGLVAATLPTKYTTLDEDDNGFPSRLVAVRMQGPAGDTGEIKGLEAVFTPSLEKTGPLTGDILYVGRGCEWDLPYPADPRGKIAVVDRGFCRFDEKVFNAERAGARGVIVLQSRDGPLMIMSGRPSAQIPAVIVSKADWQALEARALTDAKQVTVSFESAAPSILEQLGISRAFYTGYRFLLGLVWPAVFLATALVIFWRRSDDWFALLAALGLVTWGLPVIDVLLLPGIQPVWRVTPQVIRMVGSVSIFVSFFLLFPDGRFVPRWTWILGVLVGLLEAKDYDLTGRPVMFTALQRAPIDLVLSWLLYGCGIGVQVYRYRHISSRVQRQQTKWFVLGAMLGVITALVPPTILFFFPGLEPRGIPNVLYTLIERPIETLFMTLPPIALAFGILRYRLWDIDLVINRTLVYVSLTALVVGLYAFLVGSLGFVFETGGNLAISFFATALIAIVFQPLRERLQRGVNRLMYGERDDPVTVLSRLGKQLETTLGPNAILPSLVESVATALKLPYAAITLRRGDTFEVAAAHGQPVDPVVKWPLVYQAESIGELIVAPRAPGESFAPADRQLLENIAHQAGAAAHAVRLTDDLQRSRQRLVAAREEERRRLRRDLHDGLGPQLAAQTLKIGSARVLIPQNAAAADALLRQLEKDTETALADIRRLVYNLRPPTLDELGLAAAIREAAAQYRSRREAGAGGNGLMIGVDAPERLPHLEAAAEVAAYRIVQEALTNVVRHAHAHSCVIRVVLEDGRAEQSPQLHLEIADDGIGLPPMYRAGVGFTSMRERAEELGGQFRVERLLAGGTRVCADLPISPDLPGEPGEHA